MESCSRNSIANASQEELQYPTYSQSFHYNIHLSDVVFTTPELYELCKHTPFVDTHNRHYTALLISNLCGELRCGELRATANLMRLLQFLHFHGFFGFLMWVTIPSHQPVELMMSVLPLLTDRCCLVLVVKTSARFQSPKT